VEYKTSEDFSKASSRAKQSRAKKEHDHHLGRGGYAFAVPKWRKMVLTQNLHLAPSTQQAEQSWLNTRAGSKACQSIFLKLTKDEK
jgi:hypothetical protein